MKPAGVGTTLVEVEVVVAVAVAVSVSVSVSVDVKVTEPFAVSLRSCLIYGRTYPSLL